eukprot:jgi/Ulvmu1/5639/UM231_0001.1
MNNAFAVIDPRFCAPYELQLELKERVSMSGDDFRVCQLPSKTPWFVIKGKTMSLRDQKVMQDVHGHTVATMRHPMFHPLHPRMEVQGHGYSFEIVKKLKLIGHEAKASVKDHATQQMLDVYLYGSWHEHSVKMYLGKKKEGGRMLAHSQRKILSVGEMLLDRQTYTLTVLPGVDAALCVILCIAFDEFWNEDN